MDLRKEDAEAQKIPQIVRTARFVETEQGWFFRTREGIMLGPYAEKFDAELSASLLVARLAQLDDSKDPAAVIQAFELDPANATLSNAKRAQPIDLKAIRRKHQVRHIQKAWQAITRLASVARQ